MLQQVGIYNDLSKKLLEKLEARINSFGKTVRYRFDIEKENPDKTYYNGKTIFPQVYTLDPTIFKINDIDDATGKPKTKTIAIIKSYGYNDKNVLEFQYRKVRVSAGQRGVLRLELDKEEDREMCMYLELHPKLKGGDFSDPEKHQVVSRVDEVSESNAKVSERKDRLKAMRVAAEMDNKQLGDFADAMQWDSTQKPEVLRNLVEELAETEPVFFNDLVGGKDLEYRATIKQALDKGIIEFDPAEYKFSWAGNKMVITVLSPVGEKNEVEKLSEWFQVGGDKTQEIYKKLKSLASSKKEVAA